MTCIVGMVKGGKVYMGADSCGSNGHSYSVYRREKLFKVAGGFLIGCTGTYRLIDILQFNFKPPAVRNGNNREKYMRAHFIPAIRKCFKEHGLMEVEKSVESFTGALLVGFDAELYKVQSDFSVVPLPEHGGAVGCGAVAATSVLYHLRNSGQKPRERLEASLEASAATIQGVSPPFEFAALQ